MNSLPGGDPTKSDWWPTFTYGQNPIKDDVAQAQRQIIMAHLANETKHREQEDERRMRWEERMAEDHRRTHELIVAIARKLDIEEADIVRSKPQKRMQPNRRTTRGNASLPCELDSEETETLLTLTREFHDNNPKGLMKSRGKADGTGSAPSRSRKWVKTMMEGSELRTKLEKLNEADRISLFVAIGKQVLSNLQQHEEGERKGTGNDDGDDDERYNDDDEDDIDEGEDEETALVAPRQKRARISDDE